VNLKTKSTVLIKDFTKGETIKLADKYVAFHEGNFYLANKNHIKVLKVDSDFAPGVDFLHIDESQISDIVTEGSKIHGLFLEKESTSKQASPILVALETEDYQIDLNMLVLTEDPGNENFSYQFRQFRPLASRESLSQNISNVKKYSLIFNEEGVSVAVSRTEKNFVDIYYDGVLCATPATGKCLLEAHLSVGQTDPAIEVDISYDEVFVQQHNPEQKTNRDAEATLIKSISHENKSRMSINDARTIDKYRIESVFYQRIKTHCKIFKGFVFLNTYIFVAHGHILSLYDMIRKEFTSHIEFESDIIEVFRSKANSEGDSEEFDVCVLT
jgi:hypothetical protein